MSDFPDISADEALRRLVEGNGRFVRGETQVAAALKAQDLEQMAQGQQPFATILGCSDSRVPPEWVFDAGLGELFVVRVAGNLLSAEVAASMQYAAAHLRTPLFMVMGHEGCGAVKAALEWKNHGVEHGSRIQLLVDGILPALAGIDPALPASEQLGQAVEANVRWTMRMIRATPERQARLAEGRMKLVGAVYDIRSGLVRLLDDPPSEVDVVVRG
jgi:carbonic anhydrase